MTFKEWLESNYPELVINQSYHIDSYTVHDMNNCWDACEQQQVEIIARQEKELEKLKQLVTAYREKRKYDGLNGRVWDAQMHYQKELLVEKLENQLSAGEK